MVRRIIARGKPVCGEKQRGDAYYNNNQLKAKARPMGEETQYAYDESGNLLSVLDAKGQLITYEYNMNNRPLHVNYFAAGDNITPVKTVDFTYDLMGNLLSEGVEELPVHYLAVKLIVRHGTPMLKLN